jgi:hypothetical protein
MVCIIDKKYLGVFAKPIDGVATSALRAQSIPIAMQRRRC